MTNLERTRALLSRLAAVQDELRAEADAAGVHGFVDRSEWLIRHRTADEVLAWQRRWERLGLVSPDPVPGPRLVSSLSWVELEAELDWFKQSGVSAALTLQALGLRWESVERRCRRYGRRDLAAWVEREKFVKVAA